MNPSLNIPLAPFTSLAVGGPAEHLYTCATAADLQAALTETSQAKAWVLGYGANVLISDAGLPGSTILVRTRAIARENDSTTIVAEAGVWWDDLVQFAIRDNLWGLELMSGIPGSVGAAIVGNIAAYGQAVADALAWVEVFDQATGQTQRIEPDDLQLSYRYSAFQTEDFKKYVILRAAFTLSPEQTKELEYQSALDVVQAQKLPLNTLTDHRQAILATREAAGALWDYRSPETQMHTAGSFFRNPMVSDETAEKLAAYEEHGRTAAMVRKQNQIHGGTSQRVSAAHVLLAAGFNRGQTWGPVRLHPDHILKIENTGGATAQNIYDVAMEIVRTVQEKLGIDLQPEVRFLGEFKERA